MKKQSIYLFALSALVLAGCQNEIIDSSFSKKNDVIRFSPQVARMAATRTIVDELETVLASEDGSLVIPMSCEVSQNVALASTRGSLINNNENPARQDIPFDTESSFQVKAWTFGEETADFDYTKALYHNGAEPYWITVDGSDEDLEYVWKAKDSKVIFAYANMPADGAEVTSGLNDKNPVQTLTVTALPTASADQKDILLGYFTNGKTELSECLIPLEFYHPMTAVLFKKGEWKSDATISSISIEGVYASGAVTMDTLSMQEADHADKFAWNGSGSQTVTLSGVEMSNDTIGDAFILIPQTFAATSEARIAVTLSNGVVLYSPLSDTQWKAGCTYAYTIGYKLKKYEYSFELTLNGKPDSSVFFLNTSASEDKSIPVSSQLKIDGVVAATAPAWTIKSVKVGSNAAEDINAGNCEKGGYIIANDGGNLKITAAARTAVNPGTHDYWANTATRSDYLGWSPENWTASTASAPIDLSTFDAYTDTKDAHPMTTANCYIIRHAGTYKLPLVYGNAVVAGNVNEQAYKPTMAEGGETDYFLANFVNHKNASITSAFIENNTNCVAVTPVVVWQDKATVITGLSIENGASAGSAGTYDVGSVRYLQFTVDENTICQNNAVIAVKDGDGNIIWSWHIWTTNDPALLTDPISVTNYTGVEYDFFPLYNLGWVDKNIYPSNEQVKIVLVQDKTADEIVVAVNQLNVLTEASNGVYYQWGRKDPMPTQDVTGYNKASGQVDLATAISNPDKFYAIETNDWCTTTYYNSWTGKLCKIGLFDQNANIIKTVYDPSPVGYKVPASNAYTAFTNTGDNTTEPSDFNTDNTIGFNYGWYFYTKPNYQGGLCFFPAGGGRSSADGNLTYLGQFGYSWSACHYQEKVAYALTILQDLDSKNHIYPIGGADRSFGLSVRPVKEK